MSDAPPRSILPANASLLERGLDHACDRLLARVAPPFPDLMNPMAAPAEILPYLAADRGVTDWDPEAAEGERRLTAALAWAIRRQAGTRRALVYAVESMQLSAKVVSWYERTPAGDPYSFSVEATVDRPWLPGDWPRLWRRLNEAKSERDQMEVSLVHETSGSLAVAAAADTPVTVADLSLIGELYELDLRGSLQASGTGREIIINEYELEGQA